MENKSNIGGGVEDNYKRRSLNLLLETVGGHHEKIIKLLSCKFSKLFQSITFEFS